MESANTKTNAEMSETQQQKPYTAPQLIEHGTVEITGFDSLVGHSGIPA